MTINGRDELQRILGEIAQLSRLSGLAVNDYIMDQVKKNKIVQDTTLAQVVNMTIKATIAYIISEGLVTATSMENLLPWISMEVPEHLV